MANAASNFDNQSLRSFLSMVETDYLTSCWASVRR